MLLAILLSASNPTWADDRAPYAPDPYDWPMVSIHESSADTGPIGGVEGAGPGWRGVVGGDQAEEGAWPDAVGIVHYGQYVGCTGTLVANDVVLTAGHCVDGVTHILVGAVDWITGGELIAVREAIEYPNSDDTYDIAVLKLSEKADQPPRHIALDCIVDAYLHDGAEVAVVGFGSTNARGTDYNTELNEGVTVVQDHDCDEDVIDGVLAGCNASVSPGGELGAGGDGVDACYGDSGGPLYLLTPEGDFLVGVTSRAYAGVSAQYPCRDGGIYVRPDAVFDWIEESAGRKIPIYNCNDAPEVTIEPIVARSGKDGSARLVVEDDGQAWQIEVVEEPLHGSVEIVADEIVYTADEDYVGEDAFVVAVTDDGHPQYERSGPVTVETTVDVTVKRRGLLGAFGGPGGCGCRSAPAAGGWLVGLLAVAGLARRRR